MTIKAWPDIRTGTGKVVKNLKFFLDKMRKIFLGTTVLAILLRSRTLQNSHVEALCIWKDLCSWKNQKRKVVISKKTNRQTNQKKKMGSKKKERVPLCQEKKKIPLWKRLVLAELHADADFEYRSRCQTKLCHASCWKLGFLFFMQVPALIKKH